MVDRMMKLRRWRSDFIVRWFQFDAKFRFKRRTRMTIGTTSVATSCGVELNFADQLLSK